jgi:putative hydrolase of the HAD superfamily
VRAIADRGWVTFDLDGTLFDNRLRRFMVPGLEGAFLPRRRRLRRRPPARAGRLRRLRTRMGAPWLRVIRTVTVRSVAPRTFLYPDVVPVLGRIRAAGYGVAAVTNGYLVYQEPLLETLGIRPLIDRIVSPESVGAAKPDPRVWREGLGGERVVLHVGDRLEDDVAGAHQAGIAAAWLRRGTRPLSRRLRRRLEALKPEIVAASLWDVLGALEAARATGARPGAAPAGGGGERARG